MNKTERGLVKDPVAGNARTVLIAMKGHPATGKSQVAEALARRLRWPLIDKDDVKDHILDVVNANKRSYEVMWQIVDTQLTLGISAIAVSPLAYPEGYTTAQILAERVNARLLVVETVLDETEWKRRLNNRRPGYSTHKISGWEAMQAMLRQYNGCWQYPIAPEHHLRLNTNRPIEQLIREVLTHLDIGT
jgi:predicted kinase